MHIHKVISFKGAWSFACENNQAEIHDAVQSIADIIYGRIEVESDSPRPMPREMWEKSLFQKGWELVDRTLYSSDGRRIALGRIGPTKNGISATFPLGSFEHLSRWLFQQSALAIKHGLMKLPILLVPVRDFARTLENHWMRREVFESSLSQLELLSPLSYQYPFLIIGYSDKPVLGEPEITEIESDNYVEEANSVIDRCIEFPAEYHQAGLDILSYFGTYLREQYPEESASVKIEQHGLTVRMIIETESGKSEIVEKALHEYELIITGAEPPEKFASSDKLVMELKNELRIAKFRLESQQDFIGLQNGKIDKLLNIVADGLSKQNSITIDFKPEISLTNSIQTNQNISSALGNLNELMEGVPRSGDAYLAFSELEGSLISIEQNNNPDEVRRSPAMSKFRRLIDKTIENGSALNTAINKTEAGWEVFKDLASKYNKIADWCGLPQVPSVLIK
ncbi:hypothetical protein QQ994_01250 [Pseudomonas asiatica]|uniref:hypothetical protein n=1 Tax=Pseudomonas asiatica TaxID=2219225 RepID=UPI00256FBD0F|nr:hypothetical protein [Pseudomonas asiatica]WJD70537.1 hypothetical protein QQ994_01250 [Pseudomonas asiatica]